MTSVVAELWALRDGIRLCIALKLPVVEIELDAKVVIDLVRKESKNLNNLDALVVDCKEGLKKILNVRLLHCFREANKCAYNLARRGTLLDQDFTVFIHPPSEVDLLIRLDALSTLYDQFVTSFKAF
ncbi:putative ribonuclease h protein [Quercus suber]|uniref:Ribonuclease h protein n=1 Tax=Quercus suber TaxID=58331 RepID=A0AAW0L939_QUESU